MNIQKELQRALKFHQGGNIEAAEKIYRKIISVKPNQPDALHLRGVAAHQKKDYATAIKMIGKAIRVQPKSALFHNNLGLAKLESGKIDEAVSCFRKALNLNPNFAQAYNNMGVALKELGNFDQAIPAFQKAVRLNPNYPEAFNNMGNTFQDRYRVKEALSCYQKAIALKPDYSEAFNNLGGLLQASGHIEDAVSAYRKSLAITPDITTFCNLGYSLMTFNRFDEADEVFGRALKQVPDHPAAIAGKAQVSMRRGDFDNAWGLLRPLVENGVRSIEVAIAFAPIANRLDRKQEGVEMLRDALSGADCRMDYKIQAHFALGMLFDAQGQFDSAFQHYKMGNDLKKTDFDIQKFTDRVSGLIDTYPKNGLGALPKTGSQSELPVFILGMPRSGTSLVEQILSCHPNIHGAGELSFMADIVRGFRKTLNQTIPYPHGLASLSRNDLETASETYLSRIREFSKDAMRITDKMPQNFLHIGLIHQLFPKAKIIHCRRNPEDTCLSIYFQNFVSGHTYAFDLFHIAAYYRQYLRLMEHWRACPDIPMIEVRYEDLVNGTEQESKRLLNFLGLSWDARCLRFYESKRPVVTASFQQVREPVYTRSVERWRNYEQFVSSVFHF